jgi:class 3 adenylate cyclase
MENTGVVDKLLGDGIMAVYGHPYRTGEEIIQAIYSAIDMQQATTAMDQVLKISSNGNIDFLAELQLTDKVLAR